MILVLILVINNFHDFMLSLLIHKSRKLKGALIYDGKQDYS